MFTKYITMLTLLFGFSINSLEASTLHAILVADLEDEMIGDTTGRDIDEWHKQLSLVAANTGLEFCSAIFIHSNFDPILIRTYIDELVVGPDDIVFFHFSGHGFRSITEQTNWPALQFVNKGWRGADVIHTVMQKSARLNLIFFDCCNTLYSPWNAPRVYHFGIQSYISQLAQIGVKKLFIESKGTYAMTAAEPGMVALGGTKVGGRFTNILIDSMDIATVENKSWDYILDWTSKRLKKQKPFYAIFK